MDLVIKTRAELRRGLKQGLIIRLPKFWKQAAQQQQQFYRTLRFIYMKDLNKSFKSQNVLGINGIQV